MLASFGFQEFIVIGALVVLFFSAKRLPDLFKALGKSTKSFKEGLSGEDEKPKVRDVNEIDPDKKR